jgi:hypothetical protein
MLSNLDIGIDIDSIMEVCIPHNSKLPFEFECELKTRKINTLSLYEGNRFYVKDNTNIGNYIININSCFIFKLIMKEDYTLNVYIDDKKMDEIQCFQTIRYIEEEIQKNENNLRLLKDAKNEYREFIVSTLSSIDELKLDTEKKIFLLHRLKWAKQVLEVEDVSAEEYKLALQEIESIVNPILQPYLNKPML